MWKTMKKTLKNLLATAVGTILIFSGALSLILGFFYIRDGMTTSVPILLWGSIVVFIATLILAWRYKRVREETIAEVIGSIIPF